MNKTKKMALKKQRAKGRKEETKRKMQRALNAAGARPRPAAARSAEAGS